MSLFYARSKWQILREYYRRGFINFLFDEMSFKPRFTLIILCASGNGRKESGKYVGKGSDDGTYGAHDRVIFDCQAKPDHVNNPNLATVGRNW